ncbi:MULTISPECIES: DUF6624 domain-containing protein [unclassified Mycolicibacterium]|uniref:DUF6624 domain-containing protein n=1 Tax=unclassified Mycolicibacterium TaxID=2636767 RepID=UPI002ED9EF45
MNHELSHALISLAQHDQQVLAELVAHGELPSAEYHPQMQSVHEANASALRQVIDEHGWPGEQLVGAEAADAAWLIAQHAVSDVAFMSLCAENLRTAVNSGDAPGWQLAFLEDRIRILTGRNQFYGTQFDIADDGTVTPLPIENPDTVDDRRARLGLNTVAERSAEISRRRASPTAPRQRNQPMPSGENPSGAVR